MELELNMFSNGFTPSATAKTKEKAKPKAVKKQESEQDKELNELIKQVREIYIKGYMNRYKVAPKIDVKFHSIVKRFVKENGIDAQAMMKIFIESDNPYYLKNYHNEKLAQADAKKLWAQAQQQSQGIPFGDDTRTEAQKIRATLAGMHHNLDKKDYRAGVDENGHLIDEPRPRTTKDVKAVLATMHHDFHLKDYDAGVDENGRLIYDKNGQVDFSKGAKTNRSEQ